MNDLQRFWSEFERMRRLAVQLGAPVFRGGRQAAPAPAPVNVSPVQALGGWRWRGGRQVTQTAPSAALPHPRIVL